MELPVFIEPPFKPPHSPLFPLSLCESWRLLLHENGLKDTNEIREAPAESCFSLNFKEKSSILVWGVSPQPSREQPGYIYIWLIWKLISASHAPISGHLYNWGWGYLGPEKRYIWHLSQKLCLFSLPEKNSKIDIKSRKWALSRESWPQTILKQRFLRNEQMKGKTLHEGLANIYDFDGTKIVLLIWSPSNSRSEFWAQKVC